MKKFLALVLVGGLIVPAHAEKKKNPVWLFAAETPSDYPTERAPWERDIPHSIHNFDDYNRYMKAKKVFLVLGITAVGLSTGAALLSRHYKRKEKSINIYDTIPVGNGGFEERPNTSRMDERDNFSNKYKSWKQASLIGALASIGFLSISFSISF